MVRLGFPVQTDTIPCADLGRLHEVASSADVGLVATGYLKIDDLDNFPEFQNLDQARKDFLTSPHVPSFEFSMVRALKHVSNS
jgi:hypothetical protein